MPPIKDSAKKNAKEDLVYMRVAEPMVTRRTTLNIALDTIRLLKRYDNMRNLMSRKQAARQRLIRIHKELRSIANNLNLKEIPGMAKAKKEILPVEHEMPEVKPIAQLKPARIISPLEREMESIRSKLENL